MKNSKAAQQKDRFGATKNNVIVHILTEEPTTGEDLAITKVFQPVYYCLVCFGLIWKSSNSKKLVDFHTLHCCFVLFVIWYNVAHFFVTYTAKDTWDGPSLIMKLTGHVSAVQLASSLTAFVYFHYKHVPLFLRQWENYKIKHGGLALTEMRRSLCRRVVVANIFFALCYSLLVLVHIIHGPSRPKYLKSLIPLLQYTPESSHRTVIVLRTIIYFYVVTGLMQTVIIVTGLCSLLSEEFKKLSQEFEHTVNSRSRMHHQVLPKLKRSSSQNEVDKPKKTVLKSYEVEQNRLRHLDLAFLVARLDEIMHAYLLFLYLFAVPLIVMLLFGAGGYMNQLVFQDFSTYFNGVFGLLLFSAIIVWIGYAGTSLANSVSSLQQKESSCLVSDKKCPGWGSPDTIYQDLDKTAGLCHTYCAYQQTSLW